ncbi:serine-type carboxypeptidase [Kluyveromyces lactis]|uniref:Pheromone-processing carboxypeptidase KEX1 n=1 Tax=Kluyveromyces lactis (strain ATCC 8585 / CBS 2359 / DSM 70799 / NBRC 1267 / NRRL Y-1140 / WM37) TaxID=284590 RepID=KEX1_KLULA|nr:uncharacterized protein KLLA0_F09999g [Kluyveromyces lactis]Q6CKK4.1 RecName: Full=Pheromone-processing carboxypeptidase KEX1; AltName: Full=Carboxypeptidase D; Flags: Precursor [Kluyveromyces lactis NRRL Y-1140]CAG98243.1 KLLA0F09999p [Kluyveromyces lactis]|eukprot:XP_455535.1 uncharacterized protein KLLA0_F09999g [Kluyveromyces lactis]
MSLWLFFVQTVLLIQCALGGLPNAKDYLVAPDLLPGLNDVKDKELIPEMHAGHIPLDDGDDDDDDDEKNYFFWKFHDLANQTSVVASKTLIIWLNGGPGCSSLDGALMESGALRIDDDGEAYLNPGSWHTRGDIVFVDQPAGTGFSTVGDSKYDKDLNQVSKHFMKFLKNYFKIFPDDLDKDLVLAGESYAGQYIPFFANEILKFNSKLDKDDNEEESRSGKKYNLKSLLIGNGWIDPDQQSLSYIPFALENNLISTKADYFPDLLNMHSRCQNLVNNNGGKKFSFDECEDILTKILYYTRRKTDENGNKVPSNQECTNIYDFRLFDSYPACGSNWPDDLPSVSKFLGKPGVMDSLHLDVDKVPHWRECDSKVSSHLKNKNTQPSIHLLPNLLKHMQIFLFNGDKDIICNSRGVQDLIKNMKWNNHTGFTNDAEYYDWQYYDQFTDDTISAGFVKHESNLTYVSVYNASHMVPYDNALISRGIMDIYLKDVELVVGKDNQDDVIISKDFVVHSDHSTGEEELSADQKQDEDENSHKDRHRNSDKFEIAVILLVVFSITGTIAYYFLRERFRKQIHAILIDPENRPPSSNKSVAWADDIENQGDDFKLSIDEAPSTADKPAKNKSGYTKVPNTDDDSFELDNL